jgi:hypothetical protein
VRTQRDRVGDDALPPGDGDAVERLGDDYDRLRYLMIRHPASSSIGPHGNTRAVVWRRLHEIMTVP